MSSDISALTIGRPHSEDCPSHMAVYLHGLIKAAMNMIDSCQSPESVSTGIHSLMTVIEERADILSCVLDASAFGTYWPQINQALSEDPSLGMRHAGEPDAGPSA